MEVEKLNEYFSNLSFFAYIFVSFIFLNFGLNFELSLRFERRPRDVCPTNNVDLPLNVFNIRDYFRCNLSFLA